MFEFIRGKLVETLPDKAIIDVQGLGYQLRIPLSTYQKLPHPGEEILLFTSFVVKEDSHTLFGFISREERNLFEGIIEISGIGPKIALSLIGHMDATDLQLAISSANVALISKVPGIGKKTAERLIIEMRDSLSKKGKQILPTTISSSPEDQLQSDAINALINLGYNALQAQKAVKNSLKKESAPTDLSALITASLSQM